MFPPKALSSFESAADTIEYLEAEFANRRPYLLWLMCSFLVVAIAILPLVTVDVSVHAPAVIRPAADRLEIRSAESGRVVRVNAQDNGKVKAGDSLVILES